MLRWNYARLNVTWLNVTRLDVAWLNVTALWRHRSLLVSRSTATVGLLRGIAVVVTASARVT